ncbi:MAG: hypothetical protein V7L21_34370 [Nostoc sp.]|uniref:hypothetical protein n=2 Tax=unclassified Nostoc TaxID=2593658 RepID=UPI002FF534CB
MIEEPCEVKASSTVLKTNGVGDNLVEFNDDPTILNWAAASDRIILTHDRATMPDFAYERLLKGEQMLGLFVVNDRMPIRQAIDELLLLVNYSDQLEWKGIVLYLPL